MFSHNTLGNATLAFNSAVATSHSSDSDSPFEQGSAAAQSASLLRYDDSQEGKESVATTVASFNQNGNVMPGSPGTVQDDKLTQTSVTIDTLTSSKVKTTLVDGSQISYAYDDAGRLTRVSTHSATPQSPNDPTDVITKRLVYFHGGMHNIVYTYQGDQKIEMDSDGLGRDVADYVDLSGAMLQDVKPGQHLPTHISTTTYDAYGHKYKVTDMHGVTTRYAYNQVGQELVERHGITDANSHGLLTKRFTYNYLARTVTSFVQSVANPDEKTGDQTNTLNQQGKVISTAKAINPNTPVSLTGAAPLTQVMNKITYNNWGQKVNQYNSAVSLANAPLLAHFDYNPVGTVNKVTVYGDNGAAIMQSKHVYDVFNHLTQKKYIDPAGKLAEIDRGQVLMDADGHVLEQAIPDAGTGYKKASYQYDAQGNKIESTDWSGRKTFYHYNNVAGGTELTKTTVEDVDGTTHDIINHYDSQTGLLDKVYDVDTNGNAHNEIDYAYYPSGQIKSETYRDTPDGKPKTMSYIYNTDNTLQQETDFDGIVTKYQYDNESGTESVTDSSKYKDGVLLNHLHNDYDDLGRLQTAVLKDGAGNVVMTDTYTQDGYGQTATVARKVTIPGQATRTDSIAYTRNQTTGQITSEDVVSDGLLSYHTDYTYYAGTKTLKSSILTERDNAGNTTKKTKTVYGNVDDTGNISNGYDLNGRLREKTTTVTVDGKPVGKPVVVNPTYTNMDQVNGADIKFDTTTGDLTRDSKGTFTYNSQDQVTQYEDNNHKITTYAYYPTGWLKSRTQNKKTITYFYSKDGSLLNELETGTEDANNGYQAAYYGGIVRYLLDGQNQLQTREYDLADNKGSILNGIVLDSKNKLIDNKSYRYKDNGEIDKMVSSAGSKLTTDISIMNNSRGYTGQTYLNESGLVYLQHRFYDPSLGGVGQFITADATGGMNLYWYGNSDPINNIDLKGESAWRLSGLASTLLSFIPGAAPLAQMICYAHNASICRYKAKRSSLIGSAVIEAGAMIVQALGIFAGAAATKISGAVSGMAANSLVGGVLGAGTSAMEQSAANVRGKHHLSLKALGNSFLAGLVGVGTGALAGILHFGGKAIKGCMFGKNAVSAAASKDVLVQAKEEISSTHVVTEAEAESGSDTDKAKYMYECGEFRGWYDSLGLKAKPGAKGRVKMAALAAIFDRANMPVSKRLVRFGFRLGMGAAVGAIKAKVSGAKGGQWTTSILLGMAIGCQIGLGELWGNTSLNSWRSRMIAKQAWEQAPGVFSW